MNTAEGSTDLIWLIVGVSASLNADFAMGLQASNRDAPKARYVSVLSRFSLYTHQNVSTHTRTGMEGPVTSHVLELLEHIGERDYKVGNGASTKHSDDRNCMTAKIA